MSEAPLCPNYDVRFGPGKRLKMSLSQHFRGRSCLCRVRFDPLHALKSEGVKLSGSCQLSSGHEKLCEKERVCVCVGGREKEKERECV